MAEVEFYPKLVMVLDTSMTPEEVRALFDGLFPDLKDRVRRYLRTRAGITLVSWHYHLSTGPIDETE